MRDLLTRGMGDVRYEPLGRRLRARLGGVDVVDSTAGVLLWEPRRISPHYAVPAADVRAELRPGAPVEPVGDDVGRRLPEITGLDGPVLVPGEPFSVHSTAGEPLDVVAGGRTAPGAAYRLADPELPGYVEFDFDAFAWLEEDQPVGVHPREPFHRIEVLPGSRPVRLELDGVVLAESARPTLLFETLLPVRYYLPPADVRVELVPSATRTSCPYKGDAVYYSPVVDGRTVADLVWSYPEPTAESSGVRDLLCFFDERVDVVLDGVRLPPRNTPWS